MKVIAEQSLIENVVNVYVTHTQQIDELRRQAKLSFGRLSNYGFICRDVDGIKIYENGFYSKELMTLSETVSVRASSKGLFGVTPTPLYNVEALQKKSFLFYFATLPSFSDMLKKIQSEHNLFMNVVACEYDWKEFLNSYFDNNVPDLDKTALQFLTEERLINTEDTSENPRILSAKEECYLAVLSDVRHNRLTKEPYEDKENVDEEGHGIQAGIISEQMRMKLEDSLAMTFHDIARTAIEKPDSLYGHANHCSEGDVILSPLKLKTHYSLYHGFAKQLLYIFCEPYKELISPTSEKSRKLQIINLYKELQDLYKLKSKELAFELYKLMFMRLIDDMSKVPPAILKKDLKEHFTEIHIKEMTRKQLLKQSVSSPSEKDQMEEKLDAALRLLLRAQSNSLDPVIYEIHAKVLDNLVSQKSYVM